MNNLKTFYENTILENIDFEGYEVIQPKNDFEKIQLVYKTFKREYVHEHNKHLKETVLFTEWLQGLPSALTVPFYNYDIINNGLLGGFDLGDENKEDSFLNSYWNKLADAFFTLKNNL